MKERIGTKIKALRTDRLMTQSELAGEKITRSMLSLIEHGNSEPSLSSLAYLAQRLHVTPAFLLADERETDLYRRASRIDDIRIAYRAGEYRICLDLCSEVGLPHDDELNLLIAECRIAAAIEEIAEGRLHGVGAYLEGALEAAENTRYRVRHVYAEAAVIERYLGRFSDRFYAFSDERAAARGIPMSAATGNPFCAYALLLLRTDTCAETEIPMLRGELAEDLTALGISAPLYAAHVEERLLMREGKLAEALSAIDAIPEGGAHLPAPLLYELFCDREICHREMGDYKGAYEAAGAKQELLSRILSEA